MKIWEALNFHFANVHSLRKLLPATGVIWALWAQSWKKSRKMSSRGLSAPGPKKSKNGVEKESKLTAFQSILTLFRLRF